MRFGIVVNGPAYGTQQSGSALQFAKAIIHSKHCLVNVFFYRDGVYNANKFVSPNSDEFDLVRAWKSMSIEHGFNIYVCTSAALRRGIIDSVESKRLGFNGFNLEDGFLLSGLGIFTMTILTCDRMVQF